MSMNVGRELARLKKMHPSELRERYADVYGEPSRSGNKDFLIKRIIWRMQSLEQGSLSEGARARARELARDADVRQRMPESLLERDGSETTTLPLLDNRLPMSGALLTREYKGRTIQVRVLANYCQALAACKLYFAQGITWVNDHQVLAWLRCSPQSAGRACWLCPGVVHPQSR